MELGILFHFAILLFGGLIFAKIIHYFHLPDVTGYLIGGLILGPSVLGLLSADAVEGLALVSEIALGFIAFSIGPRWEKLKPREAKSPWGHTAICEEAEIFSSL